MPPIAERPPRGNADVRIRLIPGVSFQAFCETCGWQGDAVDRRQPADAEAEEHFAEHERRGDARA